MLKSKNSGFTIMELKMVVVIIAILSAAAIPLAVNYVQHARRVADKQTLTVLNAAINDYKTQGGNANALTAGKPFANLITLLQTPVTHYGLTQQFLKSTDDFPNALTVEAAGSGQAYHLTRYNSFNQGGGSAVLSGGWDMTNEEFNIPGATYYAVAEAGYSYTAEQTANYSTRKYNTLTAAEAALPATATTPIVINILGTWSSAVANTSFSGTVTTPTNCIYVRTVGAARHNGVWSNTAFRMSATNTMVLRFYYGNVHVDGLQVELIANNATAYAAVYSGTTLITNYISNMIIRGNVASSTSNGPVGIRAHDGDIYATNCIVYDFINGSNYGVGMLARDSVFARNCVIYNCATGYSSAYGAGNITNSAVFNNNDDFASNFTASYCASDDGDGSNPVVPANWNNVFVDITGRDFHLKPTDTTLKSAGTDLSASFTTDIDGDARSAPWSIGADE